MDFDLQPEWVNAIGSVAAASVTLGTFFLGYRVFIHEKQARHEETEKHREQMERYEEERRDNMSRQARLVIAKMVDLVENPEDQGGPTRAVIVEVENHSDDFVRDMLVQIPGKEVQKLIHYIEPGKSRSVEIRGVSETYRSQYVGCGGQFSAYELRITITFTDASGLRWQRTGWDQPIRLHEDLSDPELYREPPSPG